MPTYYKKFTLKFTILKRIVYHTWIIEDLFRRVLQEIMKKNFLKKQCD